MKSEYIYKELRASHIQVEVTLKDLEKDGYEIIAITSTSQTDPTLGHFVTHHIFGKRSIQ